MSYTMYTPLNVWLDPASVTDVVAYIQNYLSENTIYSEEEIKELIHDYLEAHPELIGGVQSVNGKTGTVVLSASDINTANNVTIESVLASLSSQISSIAASVATNTTNITSLTGRVTTAETQIDSEVTVRANADTALSNRINALQGAVGSPLVAATAAAMTDTSKIYVYTGSETGYTNGNWYYYNGSSWVSGGVYNATAINTDTTLTVAGMAADAKATGDVLNDLKSSILSTTRNLFNVRDVQIGKAQNTSVNANRATNFIPVKPSTQYVVSFNTIAGFEGVYWYQKTSADTTASITSGTISDGVVITTSADCAVLAIQFNKTPVTESDFTGLTFQVEEGKLKTKYIPNETATDFVARENSDELDAFIETTRNLFSNLIIGRAANTSSNASRATAYIPVQGGSKYTISYEDKSAFDAVYWYQKADVTSTTSIAEGIVTDNLVLTMNASTNYLAIQFNKNNVSASDVEQMKIQVELGDTATEYVPHKTAVDYVARNKEMSLGTHCNYIGSHSITTFNKILCVGDSLTAGVFNHNDSGTTQFETYAKYSYPTYLSKLTGVDVVNMGIGGCTSDVWYNTNQNTDLSGYDCAIIQLGVNDAIQYEGWTQTSITAFTNIINKIKADNNNVFIFVATIPPSTAYSGSTFDAVSKGIRTLVQSLNDDHVILIDLATYGHTNDSIGYNCGHFSALGYERLAEDYNNYISYVIDDNKSTFRQIQFIGTTYSYS